MRLATAPFGLKALPPAVGALALSLFVASAPPGLTWRNGGADGGELAAAAVAFGVPHPTGYPLWLLLARLALAIPLPGEPAYRLNLLSALCAAGAAALLSTTLLLLLRNRISRRDAGAAAVTAPALLAAAPAFWGQAIITEVYALHYLLLAMLLLAWTLLRQAPTLRRAALLGGAVGLGLAHHATFALALPGLALALALEKPLRNALGWRGALAAAAGALPGLALYGLLPLNAYRQPLMNWGDPRTLERFLAHVTAADYQSYLRDMPLLTALERTPVAARLLLEQFGWAGFLLVVWGLWEWWGEDRPLFWLLVTAITAILAHALHYNAADSDIYLTSMYLLLALPLGRGVAALLQAVRAAAPPAPVRPGPGKAGAALARLALPAAAALLLAWPALEAAHQWRRQDLSSDRQPEEWVSATLARLPERAVIVTHSESQLFSLWYAQVAQGRRADVLVLDYRLLALPWFRENQRRLASELPWPAGPLPAGQLPALLRAGAADGRPRPLYFTYQESSLPVAADGELYRLY